MRSNLAGDLSAGIGSGLSVLPLIPVAAAIAFGALGPQIAASMAITVFVAQVIGGTMVLLLARCPLLAGVPSTSSSLVLAAVFARLVAQDRAPDLADAMAITLCVVMVAGVALFILAKAGAAALGPLAPYPVVSGLVNGTSLLLVLSQVPTLRAHVAESAVVLATAATMLWFPLRWKLPQVLPALAAGMLVNAGLNALGQDTGPVLAAMPSPFAYPAQAVDALTALQVHADRLPWREIATAGVTITLLSVLDTLATVSALTDAGIATEGRQDLRAVAVANLAVATVAAGPPISAPVAGAIGLLRMGGTGRLAMASRLVVVAVGGLFLGQFLPLVPQGTLVGLVLAIGIRLFDREPARLLWRAVRQDTPHRWEIAGSALISWAVVAVAVVAGLAVAVGVGAMACLLVFTVAMAGSAVRRVYDGAAVLSRVRRSAEETAVLLEARQSVAVLELAGPLFFGNVSPLGRALEEALASGARHVVIDLSRIVRVDLSGARRLMTIVRQYRARGVAVVLAPIRPGQPFADYLDALGAEPGACFTELTAALAATEAAILAKAGMTTPSFATAEAALQAIGVAPEHARTLAPRMAIRDLAADEVLCRGGEPADAIFVLMQGQADVLLPQSAHAGRVLLAHLTPGTIIGERALFEVGTRIADVVSVVPSRVLILTGPTLAALMAEASAAALALALAIARNTSVSLQLANAAIQRLAV